MCIRDRAIREFSSITGKTYKELCSAGSILTTDTLNKCHQYAKERVKYPVDIISTPMTVNQMRELVKSGKVELLTKYQINNILGDDNVSSVEIKNNEGILETRECDEVLIFHGLKMELGPINDWGLNLDEKQISVNTEDFETNLPGIFAIGDISNYPGKLKLILSGFHEAALAAQTAFKRARPDENLVFRYTTSSKDIQEKLGVK